MTEFWVSQKQYFCKYCEIFIRDDAPSRRQHENGLRHQGNKERYVRGIYKQGEKRKKDEAEEKREMARIEQAANAAYAADVGSGAAGPAIAGPSSGSTPPPKAPARPIAAPSTGVLSSHVKPSVANKPQAAPPPRSFENYTTAASLGIVDPDVERVQEEAAQRQKMGFVGEWQMVGSAPVPALPVPDEEVVKMEENDVLEGEKSAAVEVGQKRPAEDDEEDAGYRWKLRKKTVSVGLGELYDPGVITFKPKLKQTKSEDADENKAGAISAGWSGVSESRPQPTEAPKWTSMKWRRPGEAPEHPPATSVKEEPPSEDVVIPSPDKTPADKPEDAVVKHEEPDVKPEPEPVDIVAPSHEPPPSLFKKRRRPIRS